jgi:hypothetical protein
MEYDYMSKKHSFHHLYKILPPSDLKMSVLCAFNGAKYHLDQAKQLFAEGKERYSQFRSNQCLWEIRAFFWELSASYEITLQWVNQEFGLGLEEHQVSHEKVVNASPKKQIRRWKKVKEYLEETGDSEWYFEVKTYRNFNIHRDFTFFEALVTPSQPFDANAPTEEDHLEMLQIIPVREGQQYGGDVFDHLDIYTEEMANFRRRIFSLPDEIKET